MVKKLEDVMSALPEKRQADIEQRQIELALESLNHYQTTGLHVTLDELKEWVKAVAVDPKTPMPKCHL
jgi:hypothetical protein